MTPQRDMSDDEPNATFSKSMNELQLKQQANASMLGIGTTDRWDADLEKGTIVFSGHNDGMIVTAALQIIGTYDTGDRTFLWGWDHPSVPSALAANARLCRQFGEKYGLPDFTARKVSCEEFEAWRFTAVGLYLSKDTGAYRGPAGEAKVFMTFSNVVMSRADGKQP